MARVRGEMGVTAGLRWTAVCCCVLLAAACGDDDTGDGGAGSGAGNGGEAGSASPGGGRGGQSSGAGTGGRAGNAGRGGGGSGAAGTQGGSGTSGGNAGSDAGTPDAAVDSGTDGGDPQPATVCKAPVAATNAGNECPAGDPVALELDLVRSGMSVPVLVTHAPDDEERLFVVERNGKIIILDAQTGDPIDEFIDLTDTIITNSSSNDDERGLLGLAFHPDYPADPRFFVAYTANGPNGLQDVVESYEVSSADPNVADPDSGQPIIRIDDFASNHNGGMLAFGTDGCLFYGTGDGGQGDDPQANGQDLNEPLGKMLRFDVDNPTAAAPGNMPGAGVPHIWDYGLRNPWRFSFDRETGDLYIGDVGQGAWEEVDVEPKGSGQKNYGWKVTEGNHCRPGQANCDQTDVDAMEAAVDEYPHGSGDDCVVGGYVYRGDDIPSLKGWYVYGDNGAGRKIRAFVWDGEGRCNDETLVLSQRDSITTGADITGFGEDARGELYVTTSNAVHRIVAQ